MAAWGAITSIRMDSPAPIFIIGSYRSATSAMTWAIGQHPNIFPLEETNFLCKLSIDLEIQHELGADRGPRTFLSSAGISRREYCQFFGNCVDTMVMNSRPRIAERSLSGLDGGESAGIVTNAFSVTDSAPKRRWVDGTPENSHYVLSLRRMFPRAKFVFMLRHPSQVARSLLHFQSIGGGAYSEESAYRLWTEITHSCALAERALGEGVVLRVRHEEIAENPSQALQRIFAFVGEAMDERCLDPFRERINASVIPPNTPERTQAKAPPYVTRAVALYDSLVSGEFEREHSRYRALKILAQRMKAQQRLFHPASVNDILARKRELEHKHRPLREKLSSANRRVFSRARAVANQVARAVQRKKMLSIL